MTMRVFLGGLFTVLLVSNVFAQGNTRDFGRAGPATERAAYYAQVRTDLNELLIRWKHAYESDDAAVLAKFYAEGASYYPAGGPALATRAVIREYFAGFLRTVADVNVQMVGFGTSGDLAYVTARVTSYGRNRAGGTVPALSTQLFVFRRHNSREWQIETQIAQPQPEEQPL